jgi:hypothetical protein
MNYKKFKVHFIYSDDVYITEACDVLIYKYIVGAKGSDQASNCEE